MHPTAEGGLSLDLGALLERAIKLVYKDKADQVLPQLGQAVAAQLSEGVQKGYGKSPLQVEWESPDWKMIQHLQQNVYEFSFAKSHEQLKALTMAMFHKETGKIIPFNEFKEIATRINNEMAVRHLKVEYETAIAGGQMASRWAQFEQDKEQFPNLTYQTVGDGRVRESHKLLNNITRPMDDAFWKTYYPPNGWGCRCDVIQAVGRAVTAPERIQTPTDVPPLFQTNLAEGGLAFPKGHPYFKHVPDDILKGAKSKNPYRYERIYKQTDGKGYVYQSPFNIIPEREKEFAKELAGMGERIILTPEIAPNAEWQKKLRELVNHKLTLDPFSPDGVSVADKLPIELKVLDKHSNNAIDSHLKDAAKKAKQVIAAIKVSEQMDYNHLMGVIGMRVSRKSSANIKEVWLLMPDKTLSKYTRSHFLKKK